MITETLTVYRGDTDKYGNPDKAEHGAIAGVLAWGTPSLHAGQRSESTAISAELFVPKDGDLKPRDRVKRANGQVYAVIGGPYFDQLHPMTGFNFGWTVFQLEAVTG